MSDAACALLERRGLRCWVAPRDILPGQEWGEAIIDGIQGARVFVLIFSGNANGSQQVRREVERAVGHNLPIIPFRIEEVKPVKSLEYFISNQHWLDALSPPMERHLERLAETIDRLLAPPPQTPPPPRSTPAEPAAAPRPARGKWKRLLVALLIIAALAGAAAYWRAGAAAKGGGNDVTPDNQLVDNSLANAIAPIPTPPPPDLPPVPLVDFAAVDVSAAGSDSVDATPALQAAAVPVEVRRQSPPDARLVFLAGRPRYGVLLDPRAGDHLMALMINRRGASGFTLRFQRPLAELRFAVPGFSSHGSWTVAPLMGGVRFPGFTATALDQYDRPLDRVDRAASYETPAQEFVLHAGERAIRAVRFEADDVVSYESGAAQEAGPPPPPPSEYVGFLLSGISIRGAPDGAQ